jgi:uncharacterized protein (TIGR00297 family)
MIGGHEGRRKLVHFGVGWLALLLRDLSAPQAMVLAGTAVAFNRLVLPRVAPSLFRPDELRTPWKSGILLYPLAVLALVVLFHDRLEVAAAAWAILAAGDGAAGVVGARWGRRPIPWNRRKTIEGSIAFALAAGVFAWVVLVWMGQSPAAAALLAAPTCLFAAGVESLPWRLDDNLTVPILSALFLRGLLEIDPARLAAAGPEIGRALAVGLAVNLMLALLFRRAGVVDGSGALAGLAIGAITWGCAGPAGFLVLIAFFVLGSATTRIGYRRKERAGIAQAKRGARSARHALANCGVAVYLAVLIAGAARPDLYIMAFVCAYATAAFDTVSSEFGQAYGGRPFLITTLRRVAPGTNGAISAAGTVAGALAALVVGLVAVWGGFWAGDRFGVLLTAAFLGSTADSYLGATLEAKGLMDNEAVNFSNTLVGALVGILLAALLPGPG